mmetsp:Transcript_763/g.1734  ORF Transcript_763/g.1734 Transcript_763/m.1734 type:complete len:429 (+) Transcript_763:279-1565(+)
MAKRHERVRHLGAGRFGTSQLVTTGRGLLSVLKSVDTSRLASQAERDDLLEDVRATMQLRHPHLVYVSEVFLENGILCIFTDYVEKRDLSERIVAARRSGALSIEPKLALEWVSQLLVALEFLHRNGVVHRRIATKRLLLQRNERLVLAGLALSPLLAWQLEPQAADVETVRYTAPEVLSGETPHLVASDCWSMGVVIFELLTLRAPFWHTHPRVLVERILTGTPPPNLRATLMNSATGSEDDVSIHSTLAYFSELCLQPKPSSRPSVNHCLAHAAVQACLRYLITHQVKPAGPPRSPEMQGPPMGKVALSANAFKPVRPNPILSKSPLATPRSLQQIGQLCCQPGPIRPAPPPPPLHTTRSSLMKSTVSDAETATVSSPATPGQSLNASRISFARHAAASVVEHVLAELAPEITSHDTIEVSAKLGL